MIFNSNDHDTKSLQDSYEVFFNAFILDNPRKYISFRDFAYKHFGTEERPKHQVFVAYRDEKPVATQWYMAVDVLLNGITYPCAQAADTASTPEGRGATFLQMFIKAEKQQRKDGMAFRYGTPNHNSMKFTEKLGSVILGNLTSASLTRKQITQTTAPLQYLTVESFNSNPFTAQDLEVINEAVPYIKVKRSETLFAHRVDNLPHGSFTYYVLRDEDESLLGYFIVKASGAQCALLCDWFCTQSADDPSQVFASLTQGVLERFQSIVIGSLNPASSDKELFESLGFIVKGSETGQYTGSNFAYTPYQSDLSEEFLNPHLWQIKPIDLDWFLNCYQAL